MAEQERNLMTSQACSEPCFYSLVKNWPLPNTKADSGPIVSECVYGLTTGKLLKSGLQFSLTGALIAEITHFTWNEMLSLHSSPQLART